MRTMAIRKMRGVIDPFTLGLIIALIGTSTAYVAHKNDNKKTTETATSIQSTETISADSRYNNTIDIRSINR